MKDFVVYGLLSIPLIGAFSMFALGISVIYRSSRVLNLAHGAMAMLPAYISYSLVQAGVPTAVALLCAIFSGALLGIGVERIFVRRLRPQGPTAQTVGTVAVAGLLIALVAKIWGTTPILAPSVFPRGDLRVLGAALRIGDIGLFVVGVVVSAGLFAFFQFTEMGLAMRGAAQNRRAASLMGIDPDLTASAAWALGGGLAALAGVLLAAVTNLDPYNLTLQVLPAFVAVLIGGLENLPGALIGSTIAGFSFGFVPFLVRIPVIGSVMGRSGAPQLMLTLLALIVMATRGKRFAGAEASEAGFASGRVFRSPSAKRIGTAGLVTAGLLLLWPLIVPYSVLGDSLLAIELALVAISLVVLIGWVGQISLAQASFVGIGALVTAMVGRGWGLGFPVNILIGTVTAGLAATILGLVALRVRGLYLAVATLIFAWMSDQFLFRSPWLGASGGSSTISNQRIGREGALLSLDLSNRKTLYFLLAAVLIIVVFTLSNLRDTKTGRAFFAVRGSEVAAASLGIDVVRYKLIAFAVSGVIAGLGGSLLMIEQRTVVPAQFLFTISLQYLAIAVVGGLGSLGGAVAAGVLFAALNEVFFQVRVLAGWLEVVSAGLLAFVLLAYPGGLAAAPDGIRRLLAARHKPIQAVSTFARRAIPRGKRASSAGVEAAPSDSQPALPSALARLTRPVAVKIAPVLTRVVPRVRRNTAQVSVETEDWFARVASTSENGSAASATPSKIENTETSASEPGITVTEPSNSNMLGTLSLDAVTLPPNRDDRVPLLEASGITVQFGGLTAVNGASLSVREHEIVGLIGPNGAGKTTFFNAILGLNNPTAGQIVLYGQDVTNMPSHLRARLGVARTFQVLQLFNELTVFENLLVATHLHNRSGLMSNLVAGYGTMSSELRARERVRWVLRYLRLEHLANESVRGLPFGLLRMIELGRALVTGARLMMLDEPASGLNEAETDRLTEVIRGIRGLGVSVLLIEHDVRMVTGVADYMHVLDQGKMIAEGPPDLIQRDSRVIEAYLGGSPETQASEVNA